MELLKVIAELIVVFLQVVTAFMAVLWLYYGCIVNIREAKLKDVIVFLIMSATTAGLTWLQAVLNPESFAVGTVISTVMVSVILIVIHEIKTR